MDDDAEDAMREIILLNISSCTVLMVQARAFGMNI